jgi:hypothetical protein
MPNISQADPDEFYRGAVYGNEPFVATWVGFVAGYLLRGGR